MLVAKPLTLFSGFRGLPLKPKTDLSLKGRGENACYQCACNVLRFLVISCYISMSNQFAIIQFSETSIKSLIGIDKANAKRIKETSIKILYILDVKHRKEAYKE